MSARPTPSSRPSENPKPPLKLHSLAIVADRAHISGTHAIEIGENSVIHPHARLRAETGKIIIGKNCTISEKATISASEGEEDCVIGDGVNVEGDALVESSKVGDWSVIEVGAKVGRMSRVGKYCKVTPLEVVLPGEVLQDYTVVYGGSQRRKDLTMEGHAEIREAKEKGQVMHVALLKRLIPDAATKWRT